MPRKKSAGEDRARPVGGNLAESLANELRNNRESGQPVIYEQEFPSGGIRATVIWDAWDHLSLEDRTTVILRAYELAEGPDFRAKLALVSGLTVPEAYAAGMLPFQIIAALRQGDPVSPEQCRQAMFEEGASTLFGAAKPQLRFASEEEAETARKRLARRLPRSEPVWVITQEVGKVDDWAGR